MARLADWDKAVAIVKPSPDRVLLKHFNVQGASKLNGMIHQRWR